MSEKFLIRQDRQVLVYCSLMSWIQLLCKEEAAQEMLVVLLIE